ncbi:MAG: hypothetical protein ACI7YS_14195 [Flavobacterium sp.]
MEEFRINRKIVAKATFKQADNHTDYYKDKSFVDRLNAACFIINQIFQVSPQTKMDKTFVQARKHAKSV